MPPLYPGALDSFDAKVDIIHKVMAAHINALQDLSVAIITELGTDPAGTAVDLKTRLARSLSGLGNLQFASATTLTLNADAVTVTQNWHTIESQGGAASDDLVTINGGVEGMVLFIRPDNDAHTIVVKHGTGNILCVGDADYTLDSANEIVLLIYDAGLSKWLALQGGGGGGAVPRLDDCLAPEDNTDLNASSTAHGLLPKLPNDAAQVLLGTGAWSPFAQADGWVASGETWTYASVTTFTISGDKTAKYQVGDKLKLTQTTVKYFFVLSVSYSAPNTTVTVIGGSDYTLANAAITLPFFSKIENPQGFPGVFNYAATITTSGTACNIGNGTIVSTFYMKNNRMTVDVTVTWGSNSTFGTGFYKISLPITPTAGQGSFIGPALGYDAGQANYVGLTQVDSGTNYLVIRANTGSFTATSPWTEGSGDQLVAQVVLKV